MELSTGAGVIVEVFKHMSNHKLLLLPKLRNFDFKMGNWITLYLTNIIMKARNALNIEYYYGLH